MANDKSFFSLLENFAERLGTILSEEQSKEDKDNAKVSEIVRKMMLRSDLEDEVLQGFIKCLEPLYREGYRHSYSNISSTIYSEKELEEGETQSLENKKLVFLADNNERFHEYVIKYYKKKSAEEPCDDILRKFRKLYDHIELEVVRLRNYDEQIKRMKQSIDASNIATQEQVETFNKKIKEESMLIDEKVQKNINMIGETSEKMRGEYISILGIFASIVLAFTGGMVFSTSVLENLHKASAYKVVLIAFIIGIVFFNIIWILLHFISKVNEKNEMKNLWWWGTNIILVLGILFTCISYRYKWFEQKMDGSREQQVIQQVEIDDVFK